MSHADPNSFPQPHLHMLLNSPPPELTPSDQTLAPVNSSQQHEHQMYKNRLQELTHKLNIPLPVYETVNEGFQHAPKFRSTVFVNGVKFTSPNTFWTRKAAEKDVALLAFQHISLQKKDDESPPTTDPRDLFVIQEGSTFCKSILNEFATKTNKEIPTYHTIKPDGLCTVFMSSLVFGGVCYTGNPAKNKKEAEQMAARAVILSLSDGGDLESRKILVEIVKSKAKLYAPFQKINNPVSCAPLLVNPTQSSEGVCDKNVGADVAATHNVLMGNAQPKHEFKPPKHESFSASVSLPAPASVSLPAPASVSLPAPASVSLPAPASVSLPAPASVSLPAQAAQAAVLPIEFVRPSAELHVNAGSSSSKKRRKNKKKANKRLCTEQLPIPELPLNQAPPCSVAQ